MISSSYVTRRKLSHASGDGISGTKGNEALLQKLFTFPTSALGVHTFDSLHNVVIKNMSAK